MLYRVLLRLIENGQTEDLTEKIDVFYASGKLTKEEYNKLISVLEV